MTVALVWGLRLEAVIEAPGTFFFSFFRKFSCYLLQIAACALLTNFSSVVFRFELVFNPVHDHWMTYLWIVDQAANADVTKFKIWCLPRITKYLRLPEGLGKPLEAERER